MKKIIIFSLTGPETSKSSGGLELYLKELAFTLEDMKIEVEILCGRIKEEQDLPSYEKISKYVSVRRFKSPLNFLPLSLISMHLYYLLRAKKKTDYIIENQSVIPLMTSFYNKHLFTIVHHLTGKDYFRKQGLLKGSVGYILEQLIFPLFYKKCNILTVSSHTRNQLLNLRLSSDKISIIPPITKIETYPNYNLKYRENIISYIGRYTGLEGNKRIDHVIEVLPQIIKEIPDVKLIIGGSMKKQELLKEIIKKNNVEDYVEFKGFISEIEKCNILRQSKVFASPSYQEGFGITYIEANSFGTPVVGYKIKDLDTVPHTAGIMVRKNDKEKLTEAIILLLANEKKWSNLSKGALLNSKRFSKLKVISEMQNYIYKQME